MNIEIPTRKHLLILGGWNPMEELLNDPDETIFDYPLMGQSRVTPCEAADLQSPRPTSITIRPAQDPDRLLSKGLSAGLNKRMWAISKLVAVFACIYLVWEFLR